jgi:hypothetical protein
MAKQANKKVSTIKLPDGQHNQTGKETLKEYAIEHKAIALRAFLKIKGSFHRPPFDTIKQAAERHGIEPAICRWICAMLNSRNISAILSEETIRASTARGCLQGGMFSPLL